MPTFPLVSKRTQSQSQSQTNRNLRFVSSSSLAHYLDVFYSQCSGSSRELTPEEFARSDRAYFDGYKMTEQGDFRLQIESDKEALKKQQLEELLGVAAIAGIKVKDPSERLNEFEDGVLDDDDLDLSI